MQTAVMIDYELPAAEAEEIEKVKTDCSPIFDPY
jgi:hypothetical protein